MRKISKTLRRGNGEAGGNAEECGADKPSEDRVSGRSELHAVLTSWEWGANMRLENWPRDVATVGVNGIQQAGESGGRARSVKLRGIDSKEGGEELKTVNKSNVWSLVIKGREMGQQLEADVGSRKAFPRLQTYLDLYAHFPSSFLLL